MKIGIARPHMPALLLCAAGVTLYLTLGTFVLLWLGVRYEADGGPPFVKIHPGTYLILAAFLLRLLWTDHPLRTMGQLARSRPGIWLYCGGMAVIFAYALAIRGRSGVAFLVDAYVAPGLLALLLSQAPADIPAVPGDLDDRIADSQRRVWNHRGQTASAPISLHH